MIPQGQTVASPVMLLGSAEQLPYSCRSSTLCGKPSLCIEWNFLGERKYIKKSLYPLTVVSVPMYVTVMFVMLGGWASQTVTDLSNWIKRKEAKHNALGLSPPASGPTWDVLSLNDGDMFFT